MISAKEDKKIFLKLSKNESLNELQNAIEAYEIKSGILEGFGKLAQVETENGAVEVEDAIFYGTISELDGKPQIEIYSYSTKTYRIKNFVAVDFIIIINQFDEIKLHSRTDESGKLRLSIGKKPESSADEKKESKVDKK